MSRNSTSTGIGIGIGCLVVLIQAAIGIGAVMLLGLWTDRNLDFWLSYFKGAPVDVPYWLSCVAGLLAPFTFTLNVIGEIARVVMF